MDGNTSNKVLEQKMLSRFHKALSKYRLIEDGDNILVGLSGGKDSLCLLEFLAKRAKIHMPSFKVGAVHVRMENINYLSDATYLEDFARQLDVPLHIVNTRFQVIEGAKKPACFLCSWHRRKEIFNLAQSLNYNKIALGHHMDDILHTSLMNIFYQGHFSTMPVKLAMRKMPLTIIRPLCLETEQDIRKYAELHNYKKQIKQCPYENESTRSSIRKIFEDIVNLNSESRYSMWKALESEGKLIELHI